jgi:hypothetical protein
MQPIHVYHYTKHTTPTKRAPMAIKLSPWRLWLRANLPTFRANLRLCFLVMVTLAYYGIASALV